MKIIDQYILKKFLLTFLFTNVILSLITVPIDISEKADDFVRSGLSSYQIIMQYYIGFIPYITSMLFPLFVFISVIMVASNMAGKTEVVAILASGIHFKRYLAPYLLGSVFLAALLAYANTELIPKANKIRVDFQAKYVDGNSTYNALIAKKNNVYIRIDSVQYAGMQFFDPIQKQGQNFFIQRIENNRITYSLQASFITWDSVQRKWFLKQVQERWINGNKEKLTLSANKYIDFKFNVADLHKDDYTKDRLTTKQLDSLIIAQELHGIEGLNTLRVERYRRMATPFSVILLTMIGVCIASRKIRGGSGLHLAIGLIIAAFYILADRFSTIFSTKSNFPPIIAAWTPNLLFTIVAFFIYKKAPK